MTSYLHVLHAKFSRTEPPRNLNFGIIFVAAWKIDNIAETAASITTLIWISFKNTQNDNLKQLPYFFQQNA